MTVAEHRRLELFAAAKRTWGEETAQTMMDLLPPDASQIATKADVATLRAEISALESRLVGTISDHTRLVVLAIVATTLTTVLAVIFA